MKKAAGSINVDVLIEELENVGFTAQKGEVKKAGIFEAVNKSEFPNCFDNNQAALYMYLAIPSGPDASKLPPIDLQVPDPRFRMRPDEAIILFGTTPGACKYFSLCPFIYERYFKKDLKFREVFNSLNDPINNMTIKTDSGGRNPPFAAYAVIIFTPDRGTKEKVLNSLNRAGAPTDIVNVSVIPSALLSMGMDFEKDILMLLFRVYGSNNEKALKRYVNNVPMQAFRVTPNKPAMLNPYPMPILRVRGTGKTEMDLMPKMENLKKAIIGKYEKQGWKPSEYTTDQWLEEGLQALQANKNMFGECRDTAYMCTKPFTMYDNEFIVIYGVDHTQTGKAAYCSAAVYGYDYFNGVAGSDSMKWHGSATEYLEADSEANRFFVLTASRKCGLPAGGPTFVVPTHMRTQGVQKYRHIFVGFRNYLESETKSGPIPEEMISPRVVKFSKPAYPPC